MQDLTQNNAQNNVRLSTTIAAEHRLHSPPRARRPCGAPGPQGHNPLGHTHTHFKLFFPGQPILAVVLPMGKEALEQGSDYQNGIKMVTAVTTGLDISLDL